MTPFAHLARTLLRARRPDWSGHEAREDLRSGWVTVPDEEWRVALDLAAALGVELPGRPRESR